MKLRTRAVSLAAITLTFVALSSISAIAATTNRTVQVTTTATPPSLEQVKASQPLAPGMPMIYIQSDGTVATGVPYGLSDEESATMAARLEKLYGDPTFQQTWQKFLGDIATLKATIGDVNHDMLTSTLLKYAGMLHALRTGDLGGLDPLLPTPNGPTICVKEHNGEQLYTCCLGKPPLCIMCPDKCDVAQNSMSCHVDEQIACPAQPKVTPRLP